MLGDILKDRNDVIWVAHHAGYYTDDFTISESEEYLAFFGTRGTFAPAMMLDRRNLIEQGAYTMDNCPVFGYTGDPNAVENLIDYCQGKPAFIEVNLSTQFVKDSRELIITVSGEECPQQLPEDVYLTIFLLENGLKGKQAGSSNKNYDHSHVIRDVVTATWGDKLDRVNNAYSIKYTTTLDSKWVEENMSVVAFISDYNKSDINDRVVYNANDIKVLNEDKEEIEIRELEDDIYANESEFKEELVPTLPADGMTEEEEAVVEDFDFEELDLGDDDFNLDDDF
jgi:hypothetical protein